MESVKMKSVEIENVENVKKRSKTVEKRSKKV